MTVDFPFVPPGAATPRADAARRRTAPLVQHAPPRTPSLLVEDFRTASASIRCVHYGERRPVAIDIAPHVMAVPVWRIDDTEILVVAADGGSAAAGDRAEAVHRAMMDEGAGLEVLRPGEGFSTWEGSPLWLRLAGIPKPAGLGLLLAASAPPRLSVMRTGTTEWRVDGDDRAGWRPRDTAHLSGRADDAGLQEAMLFTAGPVRSAAVRAAIRAALRLPDPFRWRVAEAWAAVARCAGVRGTPGMHSCLVAIAGGVPDGAAEAATVPQVLEAAAQGRLETMASRLRGLGGVVLARVRAGDVHAVEPLHGVALAVALGRLPPWRPAP